MWLSYCGNGLILVCTIVNKNLHGSYNYLICMSGIGDMMHQSCHWAYFINMVSGQNFIPYNVCFSIQGFFANGATISILMMFFVGIDRLIGVSMPTTYRSLNYIPYLGTIALITLGFCAYTTYLAWVHVYTIYGGEPVMCVIIDALGGDAADFWFTLCVIVNLIDVVIYTAVWILLKFKTGASEAMKKVFKSLLVIMVMVVFGWMMNAFVRSVLFVYGNIPISQQFYWATYFGLCANIASVMNVFVLYIFSAEYRATIERLLPFLPKRNEAKKPNAFTVWAAPTKSSST
ncbi:unnamed protein product [Bursaphelenchus okinawaensis]|uniref:G-protein coupled receptors family 1 profile domain-containing protein n=1 Tax=Bursaphelenchus okinawaensis TaxID=465554 RepID=A0A811LM09_9BILA|nr:unnamed protein product [Bursaphelenchus okinawaensis]CAG9123894.1 unnamed protein product [Bursaphelenchus okinawaensis]